MQNDIIKIAITGPESTGKTTLSADLASYYQSAFVPEYARKYLERFGPSYRESDILHIAQRQMERENLVLQCMGKHPMQNKILFCDTDLINIKIWLEDKGWQVPAWIEHELHQKTYHHYFLLDTDLSWEPDQIRENPSRAKYFFEKFIAYLNFYKKPYCVIRGKGVVRKQNAIDFIKSHYF